MKQNIHAPALFPACILILAGFICCGVPKSGRVVQAPRSEVGNVIPFNQESVHECGYTNHSLGMSQ